MSNIAVYPEFSDLTLDLRPLLHPLFRTPGGEISEFTFANLYLFRKTHNYRVSTLRENLLLIAGSDKGESFFMLPFGLPEKGELELLFKRFSFMKGVSGEQARILSGAGYTVEEDRDNFDYLYSREEMSRLSGRKFHKKKNLVNLFTGTYTYEGRPLLAEYIKDAFMVLEEWRGAQTGPGDYDAAKEGLLRSEELGLCGGIYYVEGRPAAYTLGEELNAETFVVHFEKGAGDYKGLLQFVNQSFAAILPDKYRFINREQDLGNPGLRQSKMSYRPSGFVKKYRADSKQGTDIPSR